MHCGREACSHWRTTPWWAGHDFTKRRLVPWAFRSEWPWPRRIWTWAGAVRTCSPRRRRWQPPDGNRRRAQNWREEAQRSGIWALVQNQPGDWKGKRKRGFSYSRGLSKVTQHGIFNQLNALACATPPFLYNPALWSHVSQKVVHRRTSFQLHDTFKLCLHSAALLKRQWWFLRTYFMCKKKKTIIFFVCLASDRVHLQRSLYT